MSVLNRPFTKLSNAENTETGFIISFKKFPDVEEEFYKNLKGIVTKLTSSKKTKMLSYLIDHKVLSLGYSLTNIIHSTQPVYGINYSDSNTLKNIVIDVSKVIPASYHSDFISNLNIISNQVEVIKSNESMLTATGTDQINMAKESIQSKYQDLLNNIDWFLAADIYYYQYLKFLTKRTLLQNKGKVFMHVNNILHDTVKKIITGYSSKTDITYSESKMIQILIDYLMVTQYSNNPPQETLNTIIKATVTNASEHQLAELDNVIAKIKEIKPTRYKKLEDITYLLAEAKVMNITPNAFNKLITDNFGQNFFSFDNTLDGMVAYFISMLHSSELFTCKHLQNKEEIQRMEELILNAKGNTLVKPF